MDVDEEGETIEASKEEAVDAVVEVVEEEKYVAPVVPKTAIPNAIVFHWYQPSFSATYSGLRRYGAGDMVQPYAIALQAESDTPFEPIPIGEPMMLAGATQLIAAAGIMVSTILAL